MIAHAISLSVIFGGQDIPVLHLVFSLVLPVLIAAAAVAYTVVNVLTLRRYHTVFVTLTQQIEAIPNFGLDQVPAVASLFMDTQDPALCRAIERLQHDQDVLYQQRWLPDPSRELTLEKLLSGMRLAALQLRPALTLLSIGLFAALISLVLRIQQPLANADLAAVLPWPPALVGTIAALLLGIQSKTISERLRYDLAELGAMIGLRVPVFGQQTGIAQLIDSFFHYDRQMVASLDRFNATASRLAESDMAEGIRRSVEQVLFESVAPSLRQATGVLGDLATELSKRQEQGMTELAGRFANALASEIAAHISPVNRELAQLAGTMSDIKNYTDYAVRSMELVKQDTVTQQADIKLALDELVAARGQFQVNLSAIDQQLARFTDASTRMAATYTSHEQSLAETLAATSEQLKADQKVLNETLQRTADTLQQTRTLTDQQQAVLSQLNAIDGTLRQTLTQFADESETYVSRTMDQMDQGLAQIVERLAYATAEIRDAVEALPAALRQNPHFR